MRHLCIIFFVVLFPLISFGQNEYYITDSLKVVGVKLVDGGKVLNSRLCKIKEGNEIIQYTPYQVKEFGFNDGRVYISNEIQCGDSSKRIFLEQLSKGQTTLYYYKGKGIRTFYLQKDSTLFVEIPRKNNLKEDYSRQLLNLTKDCPNVVDACRSVSYNRRSLSELISRYNQCELKPFPHLKYGISIGYEFTRLIPHEKNQHEHMNSFDFTYEDGFAVGLFIDNPILMSDFSWHLEASYSEYGYSYHKYSDPNDLDFVANLSSLKLPLLVRYSYPSNSFRPYVNLGVLAMTHLRKETMLLETITVGREIRVNDAKESLNIDKTQLGYCAGAGIEYNLNFKNSVFFELRFDKAYSLSDRNSLHISGFKFATGIIF